ncbi:MAG: COX15/CtaA family protein [Chloroflexota bacterium]
MRISRFVRYTWFNIVYNLLVILWGAYVRASGSGAGCGSHWPLCNGEVVPRAPQVETIVEFSHRLSSGLALVFLVILFAWAWRAYPAGSLVRKGAAASLGLIVLEALFGAGLVLFEWVAQDASIGRVISMPAHLIVTFLLLAALSLTAWWASGGKALRLQGHGWQSRSWLLGLLGMIVIGTTGAVTALGDTLFPAETLAAGLQQDLSDQAHFLVRLRVIHPLISVAAGFWVMFHAYFFGWTHEKPAVRKLSRILFALIAIQWAAGLLNVALLAPIWMQLVHLLLADLAWIGLILLGAASFEAP